MFFFTLFKEFHRQAAIARYSVWNTVMEGGDPEKMKGHLAAIKALYGQ